MKKLKLFSLVLTCIYLLACETSNKSSASKDVSFSYSPATSSYISGGVGASSSIPVFVNGTAGTYSTSSTLPTGVTLNGTSCKKLMIFLL